jgi:hypothetical protein
MSDAGSIIIIAMVMMLPAAVPAVIVPPVLFAVSIAVTIAVVRRGWGIDHGRRRLIDDGGLLDIKRRRCAEIDSNIHMSESCARNARAAEQCRGKKGDASDNVLVHWEGYRVFPQ